MKKIRFDEKIVMLILVLLMCSQAILLFIKNHNRGGGVVYCQKYFTKDKIYKQEQIIINVNKGKLNDLIKLDGIGPKIAERIIKYRNNNGEFAVKSELINIKGISSKKLELIKDKIGL